MIGRLVDVSADLDRVLVRAEGRSVAGQARVLAREVTITDPPTSAPPRRCAPRSGPHRLRRRARISAGTSATTVARSA